MLLNKTSRWFCVYHPHTNNWMSCQADGIFNFLGGGNCIDSAKPKIGSEPEQDLKLDFISMQGLHIPIKAD